MLPADGVIGSEPSSFILQEHRSPNLSFGCSGGGGATIVLEDLGADAPPTVTRAEFGMCAGHGVRSPTSSKVQEARVGPSHGLGRGVRPLRSLRGCRASPRRSWARGRCRDSGHPTLEKLNGWGEPELETFDRFAAACCFDFGLAPQ